MRRVLILCPGVWDEEALARPGVAQRYELVREGAELAEDPAQVGGQPFELDAWVSSTVQRHRRARIDGVVGTGDYPGCMLAAAVAQALGCPAPRFAAVVDLSHKFHSREIQQRLVPEATPRCAAYDPWSCPAPPMAFPFFTKPVKGTMSIRARLVGTEAEFAEAVRFSAHERTERERLLAPFAQMLQRAGGERVPATWFVAESPLRGQQVTVDGFVQGGRATIQGIVGSVMYPGTHSFQRFEYPSRLGASTQQRMRELVARLMEGSGFDHSCFNVELFWDTARESIHVIEVNPRMSYQFADLYERVDGTNTFDVQLALATGETVRWHPRAGRHAAASSFALRRFRDARVRAVPSPAALARMAERFPGLRVKILCHAGQRLSELDQDPQSFRYGIANLSADSADALAADWAQVESALRFDFEEV